MNIIEHIVDVNEVRGGFNSDPLQVGNDGIAMFTVSPQGRPVRYGLVMQVNIASTGPDGPFEEKWANLVPPVAEAAIRPIASGIYVNLLPGVFVRAHIYATGSNSLPGLVHLALRTEELSGSA